MFYLQLLFSLLFIFLTAYGYIKNKRNIMLLGSFCLIVATAAEPFSAGFNEGYSSNREQMNDANGKD